jgi:hypothetical protein
MTWFNDGDGWRDESNEGPYDYLATYLDAHGELQIYRGMREKKFRILYNGELLSLQDSVLLSKAWAEHWHKEHTTRTKKHASGPK